jgi:hypothetical protein
MWEEPIMKGEEQSSPVLKRECKMKKLEKLPEENFVVV